MQQGQGQWKGDIKVIEVKGLGHFAILLAKKVQVLLLMTYFSDNKVKWSEKSTNLLTKILKLLAQNTNFINGRL